LHMASCIAGLAAIRHAPALLLATFTRLSGSPGLRSTRWRPHVLCHFCQGHFLSAFLSGFLSGTRGDGLRRAGVRVSTDTRTHAHS
jgi:hypothetical protein